MEYTRHREILKKYNKINNERDKSVKSSNFVINRIFGRHFEFSNFYNFYTNSVK